MKVCSVVSEVCIYSKFAFSNLISSRSLWHCCHLYGSFAELFLLGLQFLRRSTPFYLFLLLFAIVMHTKSNHTRKIERKIKKCRKYHMYSAIIKAMKFPFSSTIPITLEKFSCIYPISAAGVYILAKSFD